MCPSGLHPLTITSECESGGGLRFYCAICGPSVGRASILFHVLRNHMAFFKICTRIRLRSLSLLIFFASHTFFCFYPSYQNKIQHTIRHLFLFTLLPHAQKMYISFGTLSHPDVSQFFFKVFTCLHYPSSDIVQLPHGQCDMSFMVYFTLYILFCVTISPVILSVARTFVQ